MNNKQNKHLVVGLGEIGRPIHRILVERYGEKDVFGYDPKDGQTVLPIPPIKALHVCIPWGSNFEGIVGTYQTQYKPELTIIHSTVPVGVSSRLKAVHSPVLGKHPNLYQDIRTFTKWFGGAQAIHAANIFSDVGLETRVVDTAETTEFLKLACLAKYGLSIAFADYLNRVCQANGFDYQGVLQWDMDYNASVSSGLQRPIIFPPSDSKIGGHCVIPGTYILNQQFPNGMLDEILKLQ